MRRDLARLSAERHDVLVVGGGIYGACVAWEAARRGLQVALIEAGDFNQGTSSNSLRTLHGGLRHLQRLDWILMRESIRERREWLRLAPELTRPMRFVLPTSAHGIKRPQVLRLALWANDLLSADRNEGLIQEQHLPDGCMLTGRELDALFPGLSLTDCNGAAAWYDGVCLNTERLQLAVVAAAVECGARVANYVRALEPATDGRNIRGARARDELTGTELDLRARLVINAAGPRIEEWVPDSVARDGPLFQASKAFNLLVRRLPFRDALGLTAPNRAAGAGHTGTYFIMPWNGYSLIGTRHLRCEPGTHDAEVSRDQVLGFLADLNPLLGQHSLSAADIHGVFSGLLPQTAGSRGPDVSLERAPRIVDHAAQGLRGLYSVIGVKWTTARAVGERAAQLACRALGRAERPLRQRALDTTNLDTTNPIAPAEMGPALAARVVPDQPVLFGHVMQAVRHEMAMRLSDLVRRRTSLYLSQALDRAALIACASLMARELRWSRREMSAEVAAAEAEIAAFRGPLQADLRPAA
jgi:glycerol-3-phosphate dehydrogenase